MAGMVATTTTTVTTAARRVPRAGAAVPGGRCGVITAAGPVGLRLTPRGRLVTRWLGWCGLTSIAAIVVVTATLGLSAAQVPGAQAGDGSLRSPAEVTVTVGPGESLWSLAVRHQPGRDPRQVVIDIERRNALPAGSMLGVGTQLRVPVD